MHANPSVNSAIGYVRSNNGLYFGCSNATVASGVQSPAARGAARVALLGDPLAGPTKAPDSSRFTLYPHAGDFSTGDSLFDPVSGRLTIAATSGGGTTAYVFDATTETYVGGITVGSNVPSATTLDPVSGRYYSLTQDPTAGLLEADVRATPPTQGANSPELRMRDKQVPENANLAADPVTHRLFLKYSTFNDFVIVQDLIPWYQPTPNEDPDRSTTNVEEAPGKTVGNYSTAAQAYGFQYRQVGGLQGLVLNATGEDTVYPIGPGTREVNGAYLSRLRLTNNEASAGAIAANADQSNTKSDLSKTSPNPPSPLPPPPAGTVDPNTPLAPWPYSEARCSDFGTSPGDQVSTTARTSCHAQEHLVTANATAPRFNEGNLTGDGSFSATSKLDPVLGSYTSVVATGRSISLLSGALQIGEVTAQAEAWAHGRPTKASGRFTRTVKNVTANGTLLCSDNCDVQKLKDQLNQQFNGVLRVDFPQPDPVALQGSKGGYQALVKSSAPTHLEDVLLNEQSQDRLEVAGMVVTIFQDRLKPSRTIINLAGVEAEARYGISALDQFGPDSSDANALSNLAAAGGPGIGDGPVFGLAPISGPPSSISPAIVQRTPRAATRRTPLRQAGRYILNGVRQAAALLPVWAVLLIPIYLSARRWLLLQRANLIRGDVR
jgi:hypothetical protein